MIISIFIHDNPFKTLLQNGSLAVPWFSILAQEQEKIHILALRFNLKNGKGFLSQAEKHNARRRVGKDPDSSSLGLGGSYALSPLN